MPGIGHIRFFYPRSPCGERPLTDDVSTGGKIFSIHALLAESDLSSHVLLVALYFSIHALLAESDRQAFSCIAQHIFFYPRSPCGERRKSNRAINGLRLFYPRSPCGERPWTRGSRATYVEFSIHALLAESDRRKTTDMRQRLIFLSTLSLRRATAKVHKTVEHFCTYETNFMGIASSY